MKKVLIGLAVVVVLFVGAVAYVWTNLDSIVKEAIETYGSQAVKTAVRVDAVKLELAEGKAQIKGLTIANPAGFTDPNIFSLGEISTRVDINTLNQRPIVIDEILISAPAVVYEINKDGVANADVLKKNLGAGSDSAENTSSSGGDEVKMIIRKITIEGSNAKVRIAALSQDRSATLPKIVMTDVGKKSGGATAVEVAKQISDTMLNNLKGSVAKIGVQQYLNKSADEAKKQFEQETKKKLDEAIDSPEVGGALKGLLGK